MDVERDDAVALLAYTMATADGQIAPGEEAAITGRLRAQGIVLEAARIDALRALALSSRDDTSAFVRSLSKAIPDKDGRVEAMRTAIDVVWADAAFEGAEMAQVLEIAEELGLGRDEAGRLLAERAA